MAEVYNATLVLLGINLIDLALHIGVLLQVEFECPRVLVCEADGRTEDCHWEVHVQ